MSKFLKHPLGVAVLVLVVAYVIFELGIPYIPPLLGMDSAPVPNSVLVQYMLTVIVAILLWVSDSQERWREFREPIQQTMVDPDRKPARIALLVLIPVLVGWVTYSQVRPSLNAPISLRSIHPAPPGQIDFRGRTIRITGLENPLRHEGSIEEHYQTGMEIYYQNCLACHGDALDGVGHFAQGFNPTPANFQSGGTISQLTESYVFWRIAKGGPGLPPEGTPWNSAMPAWEDFLTEDEIWAVTLFLYEQTGWSPRTWEEGEEALGSEEGLDAASPTGETE